MTDPHPAPQDLPFSHPLRLADLAGRKPTHFKIAPDAETRKRIALWAGISAVHGLTLNGALTPKGRHDWQLEADFTATVVQPCAITLAPVTTKLKEPVLRRYLADMPAPTAEEIEMPEDDTAEPLPAVIDLGAVLLEVLELALPLFPRAPGAELGVLQVSDPGAAPLDATVLRPFAGLADLLKDKDKDKGQT